MSRTPPHQPRRPIRGFLRGLGNVADFLKESALAMFELASGRWPQPAREPRRDAKAPNEGMGPIEKILPFPSDE
jgi:hypothetical protein